MTAAAIYTRISKDDEDTGLGVARQEEDCRGLALDRGWGDVVVFGENNTSATKEKARPVFRTLLAAVRAGSVGAIVVYEADRLTRKPEECEEIIRLHEESGVKLATVGGDYDLSTANGRRQWRTACTAAAYETDKLTERTKRKLKANAVAGWPHGAVPFGWGERVYTRDEKNRVIDRYDRRDPAEMKIITDAAEALMSGCSLRAIARDLNAAGRTGRNGQQWTPHLLRQLLLRPRNAGLAVLNGKVLEGITGHWDPVVLEGGWERVWATLTDPDRRTNGTNTRRRHLLSGIAVCGVCGGRMTVLARGRTKARAYQPASYICEVKHCVRRNQEKVDALVTELMIERLSGPDALDALAAGDAAAVQAARADIGAAEAKLAVVADQYADDLIDAAQLARITAKMRAKITEARVALEAAMPVNVPLDLAGEDAAERWESATLDQRRAVIDLVATITVLPAQTRGRYSFDAAEIVIDWREC